MFWFKRFTKLKDTNNNDDNYDFYNMELETRLSKLTPQFFRILFI